LSFPQKNCSPLNNDTRSSWDEPIYKAVTVHSSCIPHHWTGTHTGALRKLGSGVRRIRPSLVFSTVHSISCFANLGGGGNVGHVFRLLGLSVASCVPSQIFSANSTSLKCFTIADQVTTLLRTGFWQLSRTALLWCTYWPVVLFLLSRHSQGFRIRANIAPIVSEVAPCSGYFYMKLDASSASLFSLSMQPPTTDGPHQRILFCSPDVHRMASHVSDSGGSDR